MSAPTTSTYILKTPDSSSLPNSSQLVADENLTLKTNSIETQIAADAKLKKLGEFNLPGMLIHTANLDGGLYSVPIRGSSSIEIIGGNGETDEIDIKFIPGSTNQLINVGLGEDSYGDINKLTFTAGKNIEISAIDDAYNNQTNIYVKNTALQSELENNIVASVTDGLAEVFTFTSELFQPPKEISLTFGYNLSSEPPEGSVIEYVDSDEKIIWGDPISNLKSITTANPNSVFKLISNPATITDGNDGTLTLSIDAPTTGGTKILGYNKTTNQAEWLDWVADPVTELNVSVNTLQNMQLYFEITCDKTQPIGTDGGNYILKALPTSVSNRDVLRFATGTSDFEIGNEFALENAGMATTSPSVMTVNNVGTSALLNYEFGFVTSGIDQGYGFRFNSTSGEVESAPMNNFNNVTSAGLAVNTTSSSVLQVVGTNPVTTTGTMTLQHATVPNSTFAGVNQYGQFPAYYGNGKMEWGKLSSGPLLYIASGVVVFPGTGVSPNWTVSTQVFSQVINGLDLSRVIAIANNGGYPPAVNAAPYSMGVLQCNLTYASNTLTLTIESNFSTQPIRDNNCGAFWMLYYYPNY